MLGGVTHRNMGLEFQGIAYRSWSLRHACVRPQSPFQDVTHAWLDHDRLVVDGRAGPNKADAFKSRCYGMSFGSFPT